MLIITPNDPRFMADTDSRSIQNAVRFAMTAPSHTVTIPKHNDRTGKDRWDITEAILLPSDVTVILDDCHLRLADGVFDNIFRNEIAFLPEGGNPKCEQHDIHIIGKGRAILDGGINNGLLESTCRSPEFEGKHLYMNVLVFFRNTRDYSLEGFHVQNIRWHSISQTFCRKGVIRNISFWNGDHHPNQDGINLRMGCSDFIIENITGRTGDDVVALSAFPKGGGKRWRVEGRSPDIHDVTIRHVHANTKQTIVALRNTDGAKLYNVHVEDIADSDEGYDAWGVVRIGENDYHTERSSILGETYNITVKNVRSLRKGTVFLAASLKDSTISDVYGGGTSMYAVSTFFPEPEEACPGRRFGGVSLQNVAFRNIHFAGTAGHLDSMYLTVPGSDFRGCALDFRCMQKTNTLEQVTCKNVTCEKSGIPPIVVRDGYTLKLS